MQNRSPIVGLVAAGSAILSATFAAACFGQVSDIDRDLALVGGTIYVSPVGEPVPEGIVLIQDGTITAVGDTDSVELPEDIPTLDCSGLTITAGFWNSHVHFFERKWMDVAAIPTGELDRQLQEMLTRYGFTSVFDLASASDNTRRLRERVESGEVPGPRIRSNGEALIPPGALPSALVLDMMGAMSVANPEVGEAQEAAAASRRLLAAGVDGIKLIASSPGGASLPEGAIRAAVREAHRLGKPVFVHPNSGADVLRAIRGGADVVAHTTPRSGPWDETILTEARERRVALTPTLTIWKDNARHDRLSAQEQIVDAALGQLRAWVASGGSVLFGNDLGAVDYDPTEEYVLMAEAGMTFQQILASLTTAPAERFGESRRLGRIAAGLEADLVVLEGDPAGDIRALADVRYTLRSGRVIYRAGD
jgi:imidazolonepropionase-like amidohydrolase